MKVKVGIDNAPNRLNDTVQYHVRTSLLDYTIGLLLTIHKLHQICLSLHLSVI